MPHNPHDVLANVEGYLHRLAKKNPRQAQAERKEIDKLLAGNLTIQRSMMCKNCKWYAKMVGTLEVLLNTQQLKRTFTCTECRLPAHIDFIQMPKIQALRILTK